MKTSGTNKRLWKIISELKAKTLIPRPDFQRRLVWANKHKVAFIQTVLDELPFPEIYIAAGDVNVESGEGIEILVDGQQRITTLYQYFLGTNDIEYKNGLVKYSELPEEKQKTFLEYEVVIRDLGEIPIDTIKDVFKRINSTNYSLNAMEIHNSRYDGAIKRFAESLSENKFFELHRVFNSNDIKRMRDLSYALLIVVTTISTYFNLEDDFEEFLQRYNDEFPQQHELGEQINSILGLIDKLNFQENSRVFKKSDLFTLIVELHRTLYKNGRQIDTKQLEQALKEFYRKVEVDSKEANVIAYTKAVIQGTNNRSGRINRGKIISDIIDTCILRRTYYILNTNRQGGSQDEENMLKEKKAAAFFDPWKHKIEILKKGDVVFLYGSGTGIIAKGVATGKTLMKNYQNTSKYKNEEYYQQLDDFTILKKPIPATEIKKISKINYAFLQTMFSIDEKAGKILFEME